MFLLAATPDAAVENKRSDMQRKRDATSSSYDREIAELDRVRGAIV